MFRVLGFGKGDALFLPPNHLGISHWYFHTKACRVTAVEFFEDNDDDDDYYYSHPDAESDGSYICTNTTHRDPAHCIQESYSAACHNCM